MDSTIDSKRSPPANKASLTSALDEKQAEIKELQDQIRKLHEKYSQQKTDKAEVERQLKAENDKKLQQTIGLQNEIQQLEKFIPTAVDVLAKTIELYDRKNTVKPDEIVKMMANIDRGSLEWAYNKLQHNSPAQLRY